MFHQKFFAQLVLTFLLLQISHVLSESVAEIMNSQHQVSIRLSADDKVRYGDGHRCSGVLISNFTVLTAASCLLKDDSGEFYKAKELTVVMGNLDRTQRRDSTFESPVLDVKVHGRFNAKTYINNLALLELNSVVFSATVIPVIVSSKVISSDLDCYVLGWRDSASGSLTNELMRSEVKPKTRESCTPTPPFAMFCSDACVGEEGSGLICGGELRGIVSSTCGDAQSTLYTDVSRLINWIVLSHFDSESYKIFDNKILKTFVYSALDLIAYYINTPKIADDFEIIKFLF